PTGMARVDREHREGSAAASGIVHVHEPDDTWVELRPGRVRGRSAGHRGRLQCRHRRRVREPAAGRELLPVLLDEGKRELCVAGGWRLHPRYHEYLRWKLDV